MEKRVVAQNQGVGGLASVPGQVPGLNNIPLNVQNVGTPVTPAWGVTGVQSGVDPQQALQILQQLAKMKTAEEVQAMKPLVSQMRDSLQTPEFAFSFNMLEKAIDVNSDPKAQTHNPSTGELEPLAQQIAQQLAERIRLYMQNKNNTENVTKEAQSKSQKVVKDPDDRSKKKTRGNPFRVLMGQVGKLLDHGMDKKDITKYLLRQKRFEEDTISKAVDIVRDYNRKKKRKKLSESFNLLRYSQMIDNDQTTLMNLVPFNGKTDDGLLPDWDKRSTAELFARIAWLKCAKAYNKNIYRETEKAADIKGVASAIKSIRSALKKRGFTEEEIP